MTRVRVERRSWNQGHRKDDGFTHSSTLPTKTRLFSLLKQCLVQFAFVSATCTVPIFLHVFYFLFLVQTCTANSKKHLKSLAVFQFFSV